MIRAMQGRLISPADVALTAVFLSGDESRYINGIGLAVDGGFTSQLF